MVNSVYSYYLSQYGHKLSSKYDTHTRNQLKNTYGKVVKLNSQSPDVKIDISEAAQKYAIDLKENARELSNIASQLSSSDGETISYKKSAISSNEDAVSVEYLNSDSDMDNLDLKVSQIASEQINSGNFLQPNSRVLDIGTYSFDLAINDITYEFEFNIENNESTSDTQNRISRLINRSNIGLHSEVITDNLNNTAIKISSDGTGLNDASKSTIFRITANQEVDSISVTARDSELSDNKSDLHNDRQSSSKNQKLVNTLGLDRVMQYPSNAVIEINGNVKISPSNEITIDKAFALTLKNTAEDIVHIGLKNNSDSIAESIAELMSGYNNMISVTINSENEQFEGNQKLKKEFINLARSYKNDLGENGIIVQDNGSIDINKDSIREAADNDSLDSVFTTLNSFKQAVQKKADNIALSPMNYVNNKIIAYKNPVKSLSSPYNLSPYTGMMFNGYI